MSFIALLLISLFIITDAFPQQNGLTGEMLKTQHSLKEEKAMFNWRAAFDELKRMRNSDRSTDEYTQFIAADLIGMMENESVGMRIASENQKREISDDFKKLYLEHINKMRNRSINFDDYKKFEEKKNDHLKFFDAKYSIVRIYTVINIISLLQSNKNEYGNEFLKKKRSQLKTLLQETLDEKGSKSREFKLYQELLNSNPRTKSILDHNNKEALSNKLKEAQIVYEKSKENRRLKRKEFEDKLEEFSTHIGSVNILEKDPHFGVLKNYLEQNVMLLYHNNTSNFDTYFKYKEKLQSLESRLNSDFEYSFSKNPFHLFEVKREYSSENMWDYLSKVPIGKDECEGISFDNRSKMGPDSNQENTGTCWAHASAALIEEQLCLAHPEHCGKRVARTYLIGKTKGIDFFSDKMLHGENPETLLYYFISPSGGNFNICLDSYNRNPFNFEKFNYPEYLKEEYYLIRLKQRKDHCLTQLERNMEPLVGSWKKLLDFLKTDGISPSSSNHYLSREAFEQLATESDSPEEFVQKVLLSPCAQATQQVSFKRDPEQHLVSMDFDGYKKPKYQEIIEAFRDAKSFQHSILLKICHHRFLEKLLKLKTNYNCGEHAVVANAVKWDSTTKGCIVHLKNSHDHDAPGSSGWYPAEMVFGQVISSYYFGLD